MHYSSRLKFECFVETYLRQADGVSAKSILDVGSRKVKDAAYSYRESIEGMGIQYTGIDLEAGFNVDIVPANPFVWDEIVEESFDFVVSGQAFEHNPFMWITACEIARVLKPNGIAFVIAPSAGGVHRFPFDCWRYFPDSWAALAALTKLDLIESIREPVKLASLIPGGRWMDSVAILKKQPFENDEAKRDFYANLAVIVAPFKARRYDVIPARVNEGPCFERYAHLARRAGQRLENRGPRNAKRVAASRPGSPRPLI